MQIEVLRRPEASSAADAALDFVRYDEHSVLLRSSGQFAEELPRARLVAGFSLHGLHDHGRGVAWTRDRCQDVVQLLEAERIGHLLIPAVAKRRRKRGNDDARRKWARTDRPEARARGRQRRGAESAAMERALKHDHVL